ncbi:MAG: hypothetical protein ACRDPC_18375 [Solirubrobacteraceae bacterium]
MLSAVSRSLRLFRLRSVSRRVEVIRSRRLRAASRSRALHPDAAIRDVSAAELEQAKAAQYTRG